MTTFTQTDADRILSRIVNSLPGGTFELETLYPRPTPAHNIAFDAIINAGLSRRFPGREYRGFFERLYPADEFPARLLRPPDGWPNHADFRGPGPKGTDQVLTQLYRRATDETAHWADVLALLRDAEAEGLVLLGNHDADDTDYGSVADGDPTGQALRDMVGNWSVGPLTAERPGQGGTPGSWVVDRPDPRRVSKEFESVLRRACRPHPDRAGWPPTGRWCRAGRQRSRRSWKPDCPRPIRWSTGTSPAVQGWKCLRGRNLRW